MKSNDPAPFVITRLESYDWTRWGRNRAPVGENKTRERFHVKSSITNGMNVAGTILKGFLKPDTLCKRRRAIREAVLMYAVEGCVGVLSRVSYYVRLAAPARTVNPALSPATRLLSTTFAGAKQPPFTQISGRNNTVLDPRWPPWSRWQWWAIRVALIHVSVETTVDSQLLNSRCGYIISERNKLDDLELNSNREATLKLSLARTRCATTRLVVILLIENQFTVVTEENVSIVLASSATRNEPMFYYDVRPARDA